MGGVLHADSSVSPRSVPAAKLFHQSQSTAPPWIPGILLRGLCAKASQLLKSYSWFSAPSHPLSSPLGLCSPCSCHTTGWSSRPWRTCFRPSEHIASSLQILLLERWRWGLPAHSSCLP